MIKHLALIAIFASLARADDEEMGRRVQNLLRAHDADVRSCAVYGNAEDEILVRFFVGDDKKPARAEVLKSEDRSGQATSIARCFLQKLSSWDLSSLGADPGDQVVLPLIFKGELQFHFIAQKASKTANQKANKPAGKTVLVPLDATQGELELALLVGDNLRYSGGADDESEALVFLRGRSQLAGQVLEADTVLWSSGKTFELATQGKTELVRVRVQQREAAVAGQTGAVRGLKRYPILGGKGDVALLLEASPLPISLQRLGAKKGASVPPHVHDGSHELLYIVTGAARTTVGETTFDAKAGDAIFIPKGYKHSMTVLDDLDAVQVYAPKGPEQRFKGAESRQRDATSKRTTSQ
jgi:hypothetical protein